MKNPIKLELMGGLGNQLFQYYAALFLSQKLDRNFELININPKLHKTIHADSNIQDLIGNSFFNSRKTSIFEKIDILNRLFFFFGSRSRNIKHFIEYFGFYIDFTERDLHHMAKQRNIYLKGYFQTTYFFQNVDVESKILDVIKPSNWYLEWQRKILLGDFTAIHFRRGDSVALQKFVGLLDLNYYREALKIIETSDTDRILVFSDDIDLAKTELDFLKYHQVEFLSPPTESCAAESLILMSKCKKLVMSNSTFSYWAGILGDIQHVAFPSPWTKSRKIEEPAFPINWKSVNSFLD